MTQHYRPMAWIGHRPVAKVQTHSVRAVRVAAFHDLASVEPLWQQIAQSADCSVFQDLAVFKAWVLHIAMLSPVDWFVAVLIDVQTGAPLMLLPLVLRREGSLRVIEGADLGVADFVGPVTARGFAPTRSEMLVYWEQLKAALPPADVLRLSKMPARIGRTRNPLLLLCNVNRTKLSNFKTDLDADFDVWYGVNVPQKIRDDLKARRRKLEKRGRVEFRTAESDAEADAFFEALIAQRHSRCVVLGRDDVLTDERYRGFYRDLVRPGDPNSPGIVQVLSVDGEIIAAGYALIFNGSYHMIFPAFKADGWRNYSPGRLLFLDAIKWAASNNFKCFDFTIGGEAFKRDLGAEEYPLYEKLAALSPRGKRVVYVDRMRRFVRRNPSLARLSAAMRGEAAEEHVW